MHRSNNQEFKSALHLDEVRVLVLIVKVTRLNLIHELQLCYKIKGVFFNKTKICSKVRGKYKINKSACTITNITDAT